MKKQRHVWVLEDENGVIKMEMAPFFCDNMVPAFAARSDARYQLDMGQRVVKYVPENKALEKAAKDLMEYFMSLECAVTGLDIPDRVYMPFIKALDELEAE